MNDPTTRREVRGLDFGGHASGPQYPPPLSQRDEADLAELLHRFPAWVVTRTVRGWEAWPRPRAADVVTAAVPDSLVEELARRETPCAASNAHDRGSRGARSG